MIRRTVPGAARRRGWATWCSPVSARGHWGASIAPNMLHHRWSGQTFGIPDAVGARCGAIWGLRAFVDDTDTKGPGEGERP